MLSYDPTRRISAKDILKHRYFNDLNKSTLPAAGFVDELECYTPLVTPAAGKMPLKASN